MPRATSVAEAISRYFGLCRQNGPQQRNAISAMKTAADEIVTLVDIDFTEYRRAHDNRTVRKNLTIPSWLNVEAENAGINFSALLQDALKNQLGLTEKRP